MFRDARSHPFLITLQRIPLPLGLVRALAIRQV